MKNLLFGIALVFSFSSQALTFNEPKIDICEQEYVQNRLDLVATYQQTGEKDRKKIDDLVAQFYKMNECSFVHKDREAFYEAFKALQGLLYDTY